MMEEQKLSPLYKRGFNAAWRLSEEMPQIFKGLKIPGEKTDDYSKGFDDGRIQYVKEHQIDKLRDRLQKGKDKSRGREI